MTPVEYRLQSGKSSKRGSSNVDKPVVLLADDNEATRTLIQAVLKGSFTVDTATDGRETIEMLKSRPYAAVLLDLLMPTFDGYFVLDFIARERPEMLDRVLVVTASVTSREMQRVREYGINAVIAKPFDVEALLEAVKSCAGADSGRPQRSLLPEG